MQTHLQELLEIATAIEAEISKLRHAIQSDDTDIERSSIMTLKNDALTLSTDSHTLVMHLQELDTEDER